MKTVLGIDPGSGFGYALIGPRGIIELGTVRGGESQWQAALRPMLNRADLAAVVVQVPVQRGRATPYFGAGRARAVGQNANTAGRAVGFCRGYFDALYRHVPKRAPEVIEMLSTDCKRLGMKVAEKVWRADWKYEGRCSADARDAAQLAAHIWQRLKLKEGGA